MCSRLTRLVCTSSPFTVAPRSMGRYSLNVEKVPLSMTCDGSESTYFLQIHDQPLNLLTDCLPVESVILVSAPCCLHFSVALIVSWKAAIMLKFISVWCVRFNSHALDLPNGLPYSCSPRPQRHTCGTSLEYIFYLLHVATQSDR